MAAAELPKWLRNRVKKLLNAYKWPAYLPFPFDSARQARASRSHAGFCNSHMGYVKGLFQKVNMIDLSPT
ncbi:MAG: hypothetical protein ACRYGH_12135, partial [Janthinobacterium lividum]